MKCPCCETEIEGLNPYDEPGIYNPFPCPHCGKTVQIDCDEVKKDGDWCWEHWLTEVK